MRIACSPPDIHQKKQPQSQPNRPHLFVFIKGFLAHFSGLAIELIAADLPLERSLPLFRQFGNVHYDKLDQGGYSYIIKTDFEDKKALEKFYHTVILPRNAKAKMVEYKFGKRNIL